eukprot:60746-Pyramimonas_sp.AAC.1
MANSWGPKSIASHAACGGPPAPGVECLARFATFLTSGANGASTGRAFLDFRHRSIYACANSAGGQ